MVVFSASMCNVDVGSLAKSMCCLSSVTVKVKGLHPLMVLIPLGSIGSW